MINDKNSYQPEGSSSLFQSVANIIWDWISFLRFLLKVENFEGSSIGIGLALLSCGNVIISGLLVAMVALKLSSFLSHQYGICINVIPD